MIVSIMWLYIQCLNSKSIRYHAIFIYITFKLNGSWSCFPSFTFYFIIKLHLPISTNLNKNIAPCHIDHMPQCFNAVACPAETFNTVFIWNIVYLYKGTLQILRWICRLVYWCKIIGVKNNKPFSMFLFWLLYYA